MIVLAARRHSFLVVVKVRFDFSGFWVSCPPTCEANAPAGNVPQAITSPSACFEQTMRPGPGGGPAAREPDLGTGRGGDVTGSANSCLFSAKKLWPERSVRRAKPTGSDRIAIVVSRSDSRSLPTARPGIPDCRE